MSRILSSWSGALRSTVTVGAALVVACVLGAAATLGPVPLAGCSSAGELSAGPNALARAYADALAEGRVEDAYRVLSDDAKRSVSLEAFRRMVLDNPEEVAEIAATLRRSSSAATVTATVLTADGETLQLVFEGERWRVDATGIDRYGQASPREAIEGFLRAFDRKRYDVLMRYVPTRELEGSADLDWARSGDPDGSPPPDGLDSDSDAGAPSAVDAGASGVPGPADTAEVVDRRMTDKTLRERWEGEQQAYISRIVQAIKAALPTARIEETGDRAAMPYGSGGTVLFVRENGLWKIEDLQ